MIALCDRASGVTITGFIDTAGSRDEHARFMVGLVDATYAHLECGQRHG